MDLSTTYMGLAVKNPIIVASSGLVNSVKGVQEAEDAGAGAVVLKSLFEEQIRAEMKTIEGDGSYEFHPEALDYIRRMEKDFGPTQYLEMVKRAKSQSTIPIIASLNCISSGWWPDYALRIEDTGADGIELNIALMPTKPDMSSEQVEEQYMGIVDAVRSRTSLPIAVKLGPFFTSMAQVAERLDERNIQALVLFNRFYQIDIDIERLELVSASRLSSPREIHIPLRWITLLSGKLNCDIVAATGIHDGEAAIKQLLAGARAVQICSALYRGGFRRISEILNEITEWMNAKGFQDLSQFRGRLSQEISETPEMYIRLQYIKALVGVE